MSRRRTSTPRPPSKRPLLISLALCVALWAIHLFAKEGLQPDLTGSAKDLLLLVIAATQLALLFHVLARWFGKKQNQLQLTLTTAALTLSFAIWLMDGNFQEL